MKDRVVSKREREDDKEEEEEEYPDNTNNGCRTFAKHDYFFMFQCFMATMSSSCNLTILLLLITAKMQVKCSKNV